MGTAEVLGIVGQWVGAVATGGGVLLASLVYRRDSNLRRDAQAKKIHVVLADEHEFERFDIVVSNYSHARVTNLKLEFQRLDWDAIKKERIIYGTGEQATIRPVDVHDAYRAWSRTPSTPIFYVNPDVPWVDADASAKIPFATRPNMFQVASLVFKDAKGDTWRLRNLYAEQRPDLERIETNPENSWWVKQYRKIMSAGQTPYDKTLIRGIDAAVAKIKPVIEEENAQASLRFMEGLKQDGE